VQALLKIVAVVGGKHTGKTTVIENLIGELTRRGYRVGTIKEMVRIPTLDTPAKETDRYRKAGAQTIVAVPRDETVIFITKRLGLKEILPHLRGLDFVILEGFESEAAIPKVIAAKTAEEAQNYLDKSTIAISGLISDSKAETTKVSDSIAVLNSARETKELADLVEKRAIELDA
jgi:molybdopterin-guanine dinucleotide biosynthesis protein B